MQRRIMVGLVGLVGLLFAGCGEVDEEALVETPGIESRPDQCGPTRAAEELPEVSAAELAQLYSDINQQGFEMFGRLAGDEDNNYMLGNLSVYTALGMTLLGAQNDTEAGMIEAMRFSLGNERLHPAVGTLLHDLSSRETAACDDLTLNIVNDLWLNRDNPPSNSFLDASALNYGAEPYLMNFKGAPEESRLLINEYISNNTNGQIDELIAPGLITAGTQMLLTNVMYFKGAWATSFNKAATRNDSFKGLDGEISTVPMMSLRSSGFLGAELEGLRALQMSYKGGQVAMTVILPDEGQFDAVAGQLNATTFAEILASMQSFDEFQVSMPKFSFETEAGVKGDLENSAMADAFELCGADFGAFGLDSGCPYIESIVHKTFISVDEEGTEAGAATLIEVGNNAIVDTSFSFRADRPFLFVIHDRNTGVALFIGKVLNP